jgi:ectoine hydroxylase-related dioxygenase (phytanoyl-CoA dioxygenase family)
MMDFVRLTDEQRRAFDKDGFLVVRNALDRGTVDALVEAADRVADIFLRKHEIPSKPEHNHMDWRPGVLREKALQDLVARAPMVPLIVQLLSPNIHLHSTSVLYKKPSDPSAAPFRRGWHRDIRIPKDLGHQALPRVGIKVCYCLTDFPTASSGMTLLGRSTHLRTEPLVIPKGGVDPKDIELCDLTMSAGDAFLFDNRLYHTATPNKSDRTSKVLMYGYAYRWMKPEIYLENPDTRKLAQSDPVTFQLLGGYRDIDTPPWALQSWAEKHGVAPKPVPWFVEES